jgi:molybdenum cofactor synthesis domain-containing protein
MLEAAGYAVVLTALVPDEQDLIEAKLIEFADVSGVALAVTTGGTGFAPRDVTPEATIAVSDKLVPGIPEAMRAESMKVTNKAMLSRLAAGIRGRTLIINLPGSPKAIRENLNIVLSVLDHGLDVLRGAPTDCGQPDPKRG